MKLVVVFASVTLLAAIMILGGCGASNSVPPPPSADFTLAVSPPSLFVPVGTGSGSLQISIQPLNGFNQATTVSLSGLPAGVTTSPASPFTVNPGAQQNVVLTASAGLQPGIQSVSVDATAGALSHSSAVDLSFADAVYAYVASGYSTLPPNNIAAYVVDANTGALSQIADSPVDLPNPPIEFVVASQSAGAFLYLLTQAYSAGTTVNTLSGFRIDPATGALTAIQTITYPPATGQGTVAVHPSGKFLYVTQDACVLAYLIDPSSGSFTQSSCSVVPEQPSVDGFVVVPPGLFAYGVTGGSPMYVYSVNQDNGALTVIQSIGGPGLSFTGTLFSDPLGRGLYNLQPQPPGGCGGFGIWTINSQTGDLTALSSSFGPPLCIPGSIAFDPTDHFAYVTSERGETNLTAGIYGGEVDATSGDLTNLTGSPFAPQSIPLFGVVEPTQGKFLFEVTGDSSPQMNAYAIDASTGQLSQVQNAGAEVPSQFPVKMVIVRPPH